MFVRSLMVGSVVCGLGAVAAFSPTAESRPAADGFAIDPGHSSMVFRIKHNNAAYFYGRFNDISGTINLDEANPSASSLNVEIKTASVDTNSDKRNNHLKSPDFFDAEKFPTCSFKSTSFAATGTDAFDVKGDLTMHGVTKPVTIKLDKTGLVKGQRGELLGVESVFTVKRSDFGINFMPDGLGDEVKIMIGLEARKR
jgi:polyisoprenoid-binding protein YceI